MTRKLSSSKGFTLIELLVVISIIGILSSFAVVSLNSSRVKARDALRKGDMSQMRTAISIYYDSNNKYPEVTVSGITCNDLVNPRAQCYDALSGVLASGAKPLMDAMPKDPRNPNNSETEQQVYKYASTGGEYVLTYKLEESGQDKKIRGW